MKTRRLSESTLSEKELDKFRKVLECPDTMYDCVYDWYESRNEMPRIDSVVTSEIVKKIDIDDPELINDVIGGIYYFLGCLYRYKDSFKDFIEDIDQLYSEEFSSLQNYPDRFNKLELISNKYIHFFGRRRAQLEGAPILKSSNMSVALKPVIYEKFDNDYNEIEKYEPEISSYAPVVMIELEMSGLNNQITNFQMRPGDFDRFLNNMIALKIELDKVEQDWKVKEK